MLLFEFYRSHAFSITMTLFRLEEEFDVVSDVSSCFFPVGADFSTNPWNTNRGHSKESGRNTHLVNARFADEIDFTAR